MYSIGATAPKSDQSLIKVTKNGGRLSTAIHKLDVIYRMLTFLWGIMIKSDFKTLSCKNSLIILAINDLRLFSAEFDFLKLISQTELSWK